MQALWKIFDFTSEGVHTQAKAFINGVTFEIATAYLLK